MESILSARPQSEQSMQPPLRSPDEREQHLAKHERNLDLAIQHALLIQRRKDVEAQVLASIERFIEIPQASETTQKECETFAQDVSIFQPFDYDDLVEERVSDLRCGYVLCHKKPKSSTNSTWQLAPGAGDFCSRLCQSKAAYIRRQLSSIPAWERTPSQNVQIVLEEHLQEAGKRSAFRPNAELAFERGEKESSQKPAQVMTAEIIEKTTRPQPQEMCPPDTRGANAIEGYVPRHEQYDADLSTMVSEPQRQTTADTGHEDRGLQGPEGEEQQWKDMFAHLRR